MAFLSFIDIKVMYALSERDIVQQLRNDHLIIAPKTGVILGLEYPGRDVDIKIRNYRIAILDNGAFFHSRQRKSFFCMILVPLIVKELVLVQFGLGHITILQIIGRCGKVIHLFRLLIPGIKMDLYRSQVKCFLIDYLNAYMLPEHIGEPSL